MGAAFQSRISIHRGSKGGLPKVDLQVALLVLLPKRGNGQKRQREWLSIKTGWLLQQWHFLKGPFEVIKGQVGGDPKDRKGEKEGIKVLLAFS